MHVLGPGDAFARIGHHRKRWLCVCSPQNLHAPSLVFYDYYYFIFFFLIIEMENRETESQTLAFDVCYAGVLSSLHFFFSTRSPNGSASASVWLRSSSGVCVRAILRLCVWVSECVVVPFLLVWQVEMYDRSFSISFLSFSNGRGAGACAGLHCYGCGSCVFLVYALYSNCLDVCDNIYCCINLETTWKTLLAATCINIIRVYMRLVQAPV